MRLLVSTDIVGGVWCYALELARALPAEITLAALGDPTPAQRSEAEALPNLQLEARPFRLEWMRDPWDDLERAGEWLLELAARTQPDLVHLNHYAHGGLDWRRPVLMVGHSDVLSWFRAARGHEAPPEWDRYRRAVGDGLAAADHVVAPTGAMLASLARDYGPFASSQVIANGRGGFLPGEKQPFVLAAGRFWDAAKNLGALDEAAARVSWPIRVAGSLEHPDGGTRHPTRLRCLGQVDPQEMRELFAAAAIYALPARYEPFGLSVLEAALSGCALVLGDIPSLRELWDGAAMFVPPDDTDALAAACERLIERPALRHEQSSAARQRAAGFSTAKMADAYLEAYRRLTATGESVCA